MNHWVQRLQALQQQEVSCVIVTIASIVGSTPREVGCKMIVTADEVYATIGGGNLEYQACRIAREILANPEPQHLKRFPLGAGLGQCCGGLVNLLFEPIIGTCDWVSKALDYQRLDRQWVREVPMDGDDSKVIVRQLLDGENSRSIGNRFIEVNKSVAIELTLFGAGHVGRAIVNTLRDLPVKIRWVDSRDDQLPDDFAGNVEVVCTDTPEAEVDAANPNAYFLVMTHDHALDQMLSEHILKRDDFAYFGLIGSKSKRRMFETRMQRRGIEKEKFSRMTCPIGVEGISGKQPAMIAISVAAQIMRVYDSRSRTIQEKLNVAGRREGG